MDLNLEEHPENLIIPIELTKIIYQEYDAELTILDKPGQVYGKALHGNGKIKFKNGNSYEGELDNGMLHGKGVFKWVNGVKYDGDFQYNEIKGKGNYAWPDTSTYSGDVLNGLRHGIGTFISPEGEAEYTGDWVEGLRHGNGSIKFKSGALFEGEFKNGCKDGHGRMTYPSGNYYEGDWKSDQKEGQGTMMWLTSKEKYYGQWSANLQNGFGVHIWLESKGEGKLMRNRYEGQWRNGMRQGFGVFYYANGSKYEGEWNNNLKEGYAIFTEDNGNLIQGYYKADRLMKQETVKGDIREQLAQHEKDKLSQTEIGLKGTAKGVDKSKPGTGAGVKPKSTLPGANAPAATSSGGATAAAASQKTPEVKDQSASQALLLAKKKDIEMNPYIYLVDFFDLTQGIEESVLTIHSNVQTMLLRHNSELRNFYKHYCNTHENTIGEDSFSMDMCTFWHLLKEAKVTDQTVTLASVDRIFYQGVKNRYTVHAQEDHIQSQIQIAKNLGRPLNQEELRDIAILDLVLNKNKSDIKIDYTKPNIGEQDVQEGKVYLDLVDIHDGSRVILYRHFVELLVRVSFLKYGDIFNIHRSLEKFIQTKIAPVFEAKKVPSKSINNIEESETAIQKKKFLIESHLAELKQVFDSISVENKNPKYGMIDVTSKFKHLFKFLQDCELVVSDQDKKLLTQVFEKTFDPVSTVSHVDQIQKEKEKEDKERERKEQKDKKKKPTKQSEQSKQAQAQQLAQSNNEKYEKLKQMRHALIFETEILPFELEEIICVYLLRKEKELSNAKDDNDLAKKSKKYFEQLVSKIAKKQNPMLASKTEKKDHKIWPLSIKDKLKDQLALERVRKEEADKAKKIREEEKKKETGSQKAFAAQYIKHQKEIKQRSQQEQQFNIHEEEKNNIIEDDDDGPPGLEDTEQESPDKSRKNDGTNDPKQSKVIEEDEDSDEDDEKSGITNKIEQQYQVYGEEVYQNQSTEYYPKIADFLPNSKKANKFFGNNPYASSLTPEQYEMKVTEDTKKIEKYLNKQFPEHIEGEQEIYDPKILEMLKDPNAEKKRIQQEISDLTKKKWTIPQLTEKLKESYTQQALQFSNIAKLYSDHLNQDSKIKEKERKIQEIQKILRDLNEYKVAYLDLSNAEKIDQLDLQYKEKYNGQIALLNQQIQDISMERDIFKNKYQIFKDKYEIIFNEAKEAKHVIQEQVKELLGYKKDFILKYNKLQEDSKQKANEEPAVKKNSQVEHFQNKIQKNKAGKHSLMTSQFNGDDSSLMLNGSQQNIGISPQLLQQQQQYLQLQQQLQMNNPLINHLNNNMIAGFNPNGQNQIGTLGQLPLTSSQVQNQQQIPNSPPSNAILNGLNLKNGLPTAQGAGINLLTGPGNSTVGNIILPPSLQDPFTGVTSPILSIANAGQVQQSNMAETMPTSNEKENIPDQMRSVSEWDPSDPSKNNPQGQQILSPTSIPPAGVLSLTQQITAQFPQDSQQDKKNQMPAQFQSGLMLSDSKKQKKPQVQFEDMVKQVKTKQEEETDYYNQICAKRIKNMMKEIAQFQPILVEDYIVQSRRS